jgi:hypothetical protein
VTVSPRCTRWFWTALMGTPDDALDGAAIASALARRRQLRLARIRSGLR